MVTVRIAIIDDRVEYASEAQQAIESHDWGIDVTTEVFGGAKHFIAAAERKYFDIILTDVFMPTPEQGAFAVTDWLINKRNVDADYSSVQLRWMSRESEMSSLHLSKYLTDENESWFDYVSHSRRTNFFNTDFWKMMRAAIRKSNPEMREIVNRLNTSGADSPAMKTLHQKVAKIAPTDSTVLITGESGVGKEVLARQIHALSRRVGPFIIFNCGNTELIESELFGHKKGAFTGAINDRIGKFELANTGTILLDEIGDMPPSTQVKLLRVLQEKAIEPLGATVKKVNCRIICATNKNISQLIAAGIFRKDLNFRISGQTLFIPPLRQRKDEIKPLVFDFIKTFASSAAKGNVTISASALQLLQNHDWPGNIRELENTIEAAVNLCDVNGIILPAELHSLHEARGLNDKDRETYESIKQFSWNKSKAAQSLGITRAAVNLRIRNSPDLESALMAHSEYEKRQRRKLAP
jgi:DNA-binding NtrC family response regulator